MTTVPDTESQARDLRILAALWRASRPWELLPLLFALIRTTGPAWNCASVIAPIWRAVVLADSEAAIWWLLHAPNDVPCGRCLVYRRPAERIRAAGPDGLCDYHAGGRLVDELADALVDDGITVGSAVAA